ncbi:MAG: T9SS type A sorting domain-containing protein [Bacteroidetes bacterium]|nr:T9SS type A sorting domain-containing protein [Bacteroidota bacterium]
MLNKYFFVILCFFISLNIKSQVIYNAYAKVTAVTNSTLLTVNNVNQANHTFNVNEYIIVMQMQDNVIGTNTTNVAAFGNLSAIQNCGVYEVAKISSVNLSAGTPTSIGLASALASTYNTGTNSSVQIITFRKISATAFTTTNSVTGLAWNGNVGGVIAFEVGTALTLAHSISADGLGFRGGAKNTPQFASTSCDATYVKAIGNKWAGKGEGIYKSTNAAFGGARGKILTGGGGGNDENSGGGGGGNYTLGGMGGPGYTGSASGCSPGVGGLGGISLSTVITANRIFMGGGGGGGHDNNGTGSTGGAGGGIILLKAQTLNTLGSCAGISITANGSSAADTGNDGSGGGGAAGSIVLQVNSFSIASTCTLNVASNGGSGGSAITAATHSGGGGGGQGVIVFSEAQPTVNVLVGTASGAGGLSCSGCASSVNATSGGGTNNIGIINNVSTVLPIDLLYFNANEIKGDVVLDWATGTEKKTDYFVVEKSIDLVNWDNVLSVKAFTNSSAKAKYDALDQKPYEGISYYRLKIFDVDKSTYFSSIQSIEKISEVSFSLYPNPCNGNFNIKIKTITDLEPLQICIYDATGKIVFDDVITIESDKYDYSFNTGLVDGFYIVKLNNNSESHTVKVMIGQ